jgi:hypothetical protein
MANFDNYFKCITKSYSNLLILNVSINLMASSVHIQLHPSKTLLYTYYLKQLHHNNKIYAKYHL